jgi:hypothetical protein
MTAPNLATIKAAIDNLAKLRSEYDIHINQFGTLRKNFNRTDDAIDKFFGKKNIKPEEVKTTLNKIIGNSKSFTDEITLFGRQLGTINTDITAIKGDLPRMIERLEKVKIPHDADKVSNLVYTRQSGPFEWTPTNNMLLINSTVKGIYRLTLVSRTQFNISSLGSSGVNNVISVIIEKDATQRVTITRADDKSDNVSMTYYVEFVAELK